jgi:hypothetical protein
MKDARHAQWHKNRDREAVRAYSYTPNQSNRNPNWGFGVKQGNNQMIGLFQAFDTAL